jgi:hypothetical protein
MKMKRNIVPGRKRLNSQARLNPDMLWIKEHTGNDIISGYAKWFGVDKLCALSELKTLGVMISEEREKQIKTAVMANIEQNRRRKEKRQIGGKYFIESDENLAFIVGYTPGGLPYGLTHEEYGKIEVEENRN